MSERKPSFEEFLQHFVEHLSEKGARNLSSEFPAVREALKTCFDGEDPFATIERLAEEKRIAVRPLKSGASITLRRETGRSSTADATLERMGVTGEGTEQLSHEEFVVRAITKLRRGGYMGIHSVFSGFNDAFKQYFHGEDPADVTAHLAREGKIQLRPAKRGVMLYLHGEAPKTTSVEDTLKKMGLEGERAQLSPDEFVKRAIMSLRETDYKGIHSVYSGFNDAFKKYYGTDPVQVTATLSKEGKIVTRPVKGGVMIYLPEDAPTSTSANAILKKMNLALDMPEKVSHQEFVERAIATLRREGYKGIHSVYSGFNEAFKRYFGKDPVDVTNRLSKEGKIVIRPRKGGAMLYLPNDAPKS